MRFDWKLLVARGRHWWALFKFRPTGRSGAAIAPAPPAADEVALAVATLTPELEARLLELVRAEVFAQNLKLRVNILAEVHRAAAYGSAR